MGIIQTAAGEVPQVNKLFHTVKEQQESMNNTMFQAFSHD